MDTHRPPTPYLEDANMDPVGTTDPQPGAGIAQPVQAVTEPPPHQPDKAPTDKEEKNDQQQQKGIDPPHPTNAPFEEPDIAPD